MSTIQPTPSPQPEDLAQAIEEIGSRISEIGRRL